MATRKKKRAAGPLPSLPTLTYRCPLTGQRLFPASAKGPKAKALGFSDPSADSLLITEDDTLGYPVRMGVPHLTVEHAVGHDRPGSPVSQERHDEINDEIEIYNHVASKDRQALGATATRLLGAALCEAALAKRDLGTFPEPLDMWVDSVGSADTQYTAYQYLAPLQNTVFLQLGGSGSHAIKALLGGASCAGLLSPSLEEVRLGQALADYFGVGDRFFGIVGIGELIPLADGILDRVYGGGCLHHTEIKHSVPELGRLLKPGGRASFVDPRENPVYENWSHLMGRVRFCGDEEDAHDHPINTEELRSLAAPLFKECEIYESGGLARYAVVLLARTAGLAPSVTQAARLFRAERRVLDTLRLQDLYGNMAVMLER